MKKWIGLFLCGLLAVGFAACGKASDDSSQKTSGDSGGVVNDNYGDWIDDIGD